MLIYRSCMLEPMMLDILLPYKLEHLHGISNCLWIQVVLISVSHLQIVIMEPWLRPAPGVAGENCQSRRGGCVS